MDKEKLALAGKKDGDEPEDGKEKKGQAADDETGAKAPCDTKKAGEKKDGDKKDGDQDDENEGKKAAANVLLIGQPLEGMRSESDILAIGALCKMAGRPAMAAEFLTKKGASGKYLSVAEVSEALTNSRVAESERSMITSYVNPNAGAGGVQELEAQATQFARQNRMQVSADMYVAGAEVRVTKERAYAAMLEEHPSQGPPGAAIHCAVGAAAVTRHQGEEGGIGCLTRRALNSRSTRDAS